MIFGSDILEVALGLFFIYFLGSLLASAIVELIAQLLRQRAKQLEQGIVELFNGPANQPKMVDAANQEEATAQQKLAQSLANKILGSPVIASLTSQARSWIGQLFSNVDKPSYIPARFFSTAMLEVLDRNSNLSTIVATPAATNGGTNSSGLQFTASVPNQLQQVLNTFVSSERSHFDFKELETAVTVIDRASGDLKTQLQQVIATEGVKLEQLRKAIEDWYDAKMDRVSGAYKRWARIWLLVVGLLLALALNLDSINIVKTLWTNGALRHALADQVSTQIGQQTDVNKVVTSVDEIRKLLNDQQKAGLPIGWEPFSWDKVLPWNWSSGDWAIVPGKLLGALITAIALSMGAPFWFDTLSKIASLRSTGKPPTSSTETDNSSSGK